MEKEATPIPEKANTKHKRKMKRPEGETIYYIRSYLLQQLPLLLRTSAETLEVLPSLFDCRGQSQRQTFYCLSKVMR